MDVVVNRLDFESGMCMTGPELLWTSSGVFRVMVGV